MPFVFVAGLMIIEPVLAWIGMGINKRTDIEYVGFAREHFGCSWLKAGNCVTSWSEIIQSQLGAAIINIALGMVLIIILAYVIRLLWRRKYWQAWGVTILFATVSFFEFLVGAYGNADTFTWDFSWYKVFQLIYFVPLLVLLGVLVSVIRLVVDRRTRRTDRPKTPIDGS